MLKTFFTSPVFHAIILILLAIVISFVLYAVFIWKKRLVSKYFSLMFAFSGILILICATCLGAIKDLEDYLFWLIIIEVVICLFGFIKDFNFKFNGVEIAVKLHDMDREIQKQKIQKKFLYNKENKMEKTNKTSDKASISVELEKEFEKIYQESQDADELAKKIVEYYCFNKKINLFQFRKNISMNDIETVYGTWFDWFRDDDWPVAFVVKFKEMDLFDYDDLYKKIADIRYYNAVTKKSAKIILINANCKKRNLGLPESDLNELKSQFKFAIEANLFEIESITIPESKL